MCIFSGEVTSVSSTNIFARDVGGGRQVLAYEMTVAMKDAVAMVLPLPVPAVCGDDAVRFIDLSGCDDLFEQLLAAFPEPVWRGGMQPISGGAVAASAHIAVHEVGDYEASFVPTLGDFRRLDPRFRLSDELWAALPTYADYGFAVFKLAKADKWSPDHPIAFEFPRRDQGLFFPTVHVHGGVVHAQAHFDHVLYAQTTTVSHDGWRRSEQAARHIVKTGDHAGLIDPEQHVYQRKLRGNYDNTDVRL